MKRFIIGISAIILLLFIGFIAVFYGGFYVDSGRDNHVNTFVRTENKEILIKDKDEWKPFEVRGIDMGSGIPGEWSTDYAITKETYLHWFQLIQEAGANTLRVYSVQNPSFYKAFYEYNSQHEEPLYLLQGIWVNDYIQNSRVDAYADSFAGKLLDNCLVTVDVIHGKRLIINNDADTSTGLYLHDVSKWVLGYIIGNGWEDTTVAYTDEKYPDMEPYKGTYLTASKDASAFESLLAETGDRMLHYESTRYDEQRLISFSSGNATDPFDYPKEIAEYFRKCARIDTEHITATDKFISGQFASYSASPYVFAIFHMTKFQAKEIVFPFLFDLLGNKSLYCRENALRALYSSEDIHAVMQALTFLDANEQLLPHEKILADGLLSFDKKEELIPLLWEKMSEFHPRMQVSLLDYIRYASSNWKDEMLSMLETSQDMEIQIACVRYFGRYQDERSVPFLLHHAEEEKEGFWELQNACISALAVYPGPQTLEILKKETSSKNWYVRRNAAKSLAVLNTDRDALADILQGNDRYAKEMLEYQLDAVKAQRGAGL